jgi:hypothetical protein
MTTLGNAFDERPAFPGLIAPLGRFHVTLRDLRRLVMSAARVGVHIGWA